MLLLTPVLHSILTSAEHKKLLHIDKPLHKLEVRAACCRAPLAP